MTDSSVPSVYRNYTIRRLRKSDISTRLPPITETSDCKDYVNECFIATVVYGDANAPEVEALRDFRDHVLSQTNLGRRAVSFYYSGAGKRMAKFIEKTAPSAVPIIRKGLDALVAYHLRRT